MPESTLRDPVTELQEPLAELRPAPTPTPSSTPAMGFWPRAGILAALTVLASFNMCAAVVADALAGSRTAYLVVLPVLLVLIACGYRQAARGVADSETDWIAVLLVGGAGFTGLHLLAARMPTTAAVWGLPALSALLFLGCAMAVLFGVRQVVRMWPLWLFAVVMATPLPYLLTVAALGGSDTAAAATAAAAGVVAVWLGTRTGPAGGRLLAVLGAAGASTAFVLAWAGRAPLLVDVLVAGAVIPVLTYVAFVLRTRGAAAADAAGPTDYPRRTPTSLVTLAVAAAALFALSPAPASEPALPTVDAGWTGRAGLGAPTHFDFVTRYLGPGATLRRYEIAPSGGRPAAAVDVLSSPDRAALDDYADTVWYPSGRPVQYRPVELGGAMPLTGRVAHTDAAAATTSTAQDWYAVSWQWHAAGEYQQVTVVVNQRIEANQPPPAPTPPSLGRSVIAPALWLARQQANGSGEVDPLVIRRADDLVDFLVTSTGDQAGDPIGV